MKHLTVFSLVSSLSLTLMTLTSLVATGQAQAATTVVSPAKGIRITSDDKQFSLRIGGRLHVDGATFDEDVTPLEDDIIFRRARLAASGKAFGDWRYRFDYDFAANSDYRIKGAWLRYDGFRPLRITAGNVQEPLSLEELTSSNGITFMERSLISAFTPSYHLGALLTSHGRNWSAAAGYFGETIGEQKTDRLSSGRGLAGRLTFAPVKAKRRALHLGVSAEYRDPGSDTVRYSTRPESKVTDRRLVTTRTIKNVSDTLIYGLEGALVQGPWSVQGEYMQARVNRRGGDDLAFDGWYAFVSWFVSGESRRYNAKKGSFKKLKPKGRYGAWELAARYSHADFTDGAVQGGKETNITYGLNWYLNRNLRFMANYILVSADPNRYGDKDEPRILQFRAQYFF